jgi:ferritin-like metal-binding protein YciE
MLKLNQILEQKLGEALGLEMAAQKAVEELILKGLLDKRGIKTKVQNMKKEASTHQMQLEELVESLSESQEINSESIQNTARETEEKASKMMQIYLGEDPDTAEALEFLCLAEGGEVTHYEILSALAQEVKAKGFSTKVRSILKEEKEHFQMCIDLAKENVAKE